MSSRRGGVASAAASQFDVMKFCADAQVAAQIFGVLGQSLQRPLVARR
jgi:hypothetical protein